MMKSVFLSDSTMLDNFSSNKNSPGNSSSEGFNTDNDADYIMVEVGPGSFVEDDDDEYDYCDDIVSEREEPAFFPDNNDDNNNLDLIDEDEMILEEAVGQPSIRQILEKAHESASQVVSYVTDEEDQDDHEDHEDEVNASSSKTEVAAATSASLSATIKEQPQEITDVPESQASAKTKEVHATNEEASSPPVDITDAATSMVKASSAPDNAMTTAPPNLGRMSNKKRRKKMKLMKKAAAAAKAVATLTTSADAPPLSSSSSSSSKVTEKAKKGSDSSKSSLASFPQTRYYNKRVASIAAVACATETLASYKAKVNQKHGSKVHG